MTKRFYTTLAIIAVTVLAFSCSNGRPSYPQMLKSQTKALNKFFADSGIVILKNYPANGVFAPNEFFQLSNEVYLNVVDSGNGNRAKLGETSILCRFQAKGLMYYDTITFENFSNGTNPIVYKYGSSQPTSVDYYTSDLFCIALFTPLEYVGDSSEVKMIIPFQVETNSATFQNQGEPVYYQKVRYKFEIR